LAHLLYPQPRVGVACIAMWQGKVAMGFRIGKRIGSARWQFAGGGLEWNESFEACALRELWEEFGLAGHNPVVVEATSNLYPDEGEHAVTVWVACEVVNPDQIRNCEPEKCRDVGWYDENALPAPAFEPCKVISSGRLRGVYLNSLKTVESSP
jgi:8-oxo-dGTP diphosphatase